MTYSNPGECSQDHKPRCQLRKMRVDISSRQRSSRIQQKHQPLTHLKSTPPVSFTSAPILSFSSPSFSTHLHSINHTDQSIPSMEPIQSSNKLTQPRGIPTTDRRELRRCWIMLFHFEVIYSVLPKIIGQGSVFFGVEALANLRGHWGAFLVEYHSMKSFAEKKVGTAKHWLMYPTN